jgi:hypothetical protein
MSTQTEIIVTAIRNALIEMRQNDCNSVLYFVQIGQDLIRLKQVIYHGQLAIVLRRLNLHPRFAARCMALARTWWRDTEKLKRVGVLEQLSGDILKLEFLCRLEPEELREMLKYVDVRRVNRVQVRDFVRRARGETMPTPELKKHSAEEVQAFWYNCCLRLSQRLDNLSGDLDNSEKDLLFTLLDLELDTVLDMAAAQVESFDPFDSRGHQICNAAENVPAADPVANTVETPTADVTSDAADPTSANT